MPRAAARPTPSPSSAVKQAWGPAPWLAPDRVDAELAQPQRRVARGHAGERLAVLVEGQERDDRQRGHAADGRDRRLQLVQVVERLDEEEVDAAGLEQLRLLGEELAPSVLRVADVAERPDRAGDQHLRARDLPRLAGDLHRLRVDALDLVLEEARGQLAPVGAEGVRLDQLGSRADEADVQREHALGRADVRLLGAAQPRNRARDQGSHAAVAADRRAAREALEEGVRHRATLKAAAGAADEPASSSDRETNGRVSGRAGDRRRASARRFILPRHGSTAQVTPRSCNRETSPSRGSPKGT